MQEVGSGSKIKAEFAADFSLIDELCDTIQEKFVNSFDLKELFHRRIENACRKQVCRPK